MECSTAAPHLDYVSSKDAIADQICKWGHASSVTVLDSVCDIFRMPDREGIIGYRSCYGCNVAFGDPICLPEDTLKFAQAFKEFSASEGKSVIYLTATENFTKLLFQHFGGALINVAEELYLDPEFFPKQGSKGRLLRKKMNHAKNEGVSVKEYRYNDPHSQKELEEVAASWLKGRHGPQIYFAHLDLFEDKLEKRWFYAEKDQQLVGTALLYRLNAQNGWLLHMLMPIPDAPNGTSEYLVLEIMDQLTKESCHYLSFSSTPSELLGEIQGMSKFAEATTRFLFKSTKNFFGLDGRRNYWKKFDPQSAPTYLYSSKPRLGFKEVMAMLKALNISLKA